MPSLEQLAEAAVRHHRASEFALAEPLYQQILTIEPDLPQILHLYGALALQTQRPALAEQLITRALALQPDPNFCGTLGNVYQAQGKSAEAEAAYRRGVGLNPRDHRLHSNLGNILAAQRKFDQAIEAFRTALTLKPDFVEASINLGAALSELNRHAEAIECHRKAIALNPNFPEVFNNLSSSLLTIGQANEAIDAANAALHLRPEYPHALNNLGNALRQRFRIEDAARAYQQALEIDPNYVAARNKYANTLRELERFEDAIAQYRMAIQAKPDFLEPRLNLGMLLSDLGRNEEATAEYEAAAAADPKSAAPYNCAGMLYVNSSQLGEAIDAFRKALELSPGVAEIHCNLANALSKQGRLDESVSEYRHALWFKSDYPAAESNLLLAMHFDERIAPDQMFAAHLDWAKKYETPLMHAQKPHANDRDPERRLRIGYVSADLGTHPVGRFMKPLLESHDRGKFEIFCYASNPSIDPFTQTLRPLVDQWRSTAAMPDDVLTETIRDDSIDILVDLSGHTASNRLLTLARKPAPVQATYLGYPDTTGLKSIDYRIVDAISDPPGQSDELHTEKLWRLDGPFLCYQPRVDQKIAPPPFETNGYVTFGSFNNLAKISPSVMRLWSQLLAATPGARLRIKALQLGDDATRAILAESLQREGVPLDRVDIVPPLVAFVDHLEAYDQIDVALDTFPYNGTTTTCEALAKGVPVMTLAGKTHVSRTGASILTHCGLSEFVADSPEDYVRIATELANDRERLKNLRSTLPERIANSPLAGAARLARSIESAYRQMWKEFTSRA